MPCRGIDMTFVYHFIWVETGSHGVTKSRRQVLLRLDWVLGC